MLIDEFLVPKILIVSGKGGVGKTTIAAALAVVAARNGRKVCVAEVDRKGALGRLFGGGTLEYAPSELAPGVWGMTIIPEHSLAEYLEFQYRMKRISRVFTSTQFVDYITTAAPGLKDILVLGKVWYLEQGHGQTRHRFDTIILDAPAAGHMRTFLSAPLGLSDAVRVGPVRRQSDWLLEMLRDPSRTRVHLVTLPEEIPVSETLETSSALRERMGMEPGAAFVNAVYSRLFTDKEEALLEKLVAESKAASVVTEGKKVGLSLDEEDVDALLRYGRFLSARRAIQSRYLKTLVEKLEEPVMELPFLFSAGLALPDIENLADVIEERIEKL